MDPEGDGERKKRMRDNGERIYEGLMGREKMQKLEEENIPPKEADFPWENDNYKLSNLVNNLLPKDIGA